MYTAIMLLLYPVNIGHRIIRIQFQSPEPAGWNLKVGSALRKRYTGNFNSRPGEKYVLQEVWIPKRIVTIIDCPVVALTELEFISLSKVYLNVIEVVVRVIIKVIIHSPTGSVHTADDAPAGEGLFRKAPEKVREAWPVQAEEVEKALMRLWEEENKPDHVPDMLCNLSGEMLGACFVPDPDDLWAPQLYAVGEGLGRFVYWMDAWEDYDADMKAKRFNPLHTRCKPRIINHNKKGKSWTTFRKRQKER